MALSGPSYTYLSNVVESLAEMQKSAPTFSWAQSLLLDSATLLLDSAATLLEDSTASLLAELDNLQATRSRIPLLRQTLSEQRQRQTMQLLSVDPMQRRPENTAGGLTGSYRQTLVSDGIAGAPTERSMLEISRYFERDARRYG